MPLTPVMPLGIEGFNYADLHDPARLRDLYEVFCRDVEARDPQFWSEWEPYRTSPHAQRSSIERSDLIVRMAPHVSRFVAALFGVDESAAGIVAGTHQLDPLFRFKIDFVRKRALPLVKGGRTSLSRQRRRRSSSSSPNRMGTSIWSLPLPRPDARCSTGRQQWRHGAAAGRFACEAILALPLITVLTVAARQPYRRCTRAPRRISGRP